MQNRIKELDALRGIAALMVVLFHYTYFNGIELFGIGCMGVDIFFIISGFVIVMSIEKVSNWQTFAIHRFLRLYPVYWFCVSFTAGTMLYLNKFSFDYKIEGLLIKYLGNLTMFQRYFNIENLDDSYWTLRIEMQFYFLMGLCIFLKKIKSIENICVVLLFTCAIFIFKIESSYLANFKRVISIVIYFPLFHAGILFYFMRRYGINKKRIILLIMTFVIQCLLFQESFRNTNILVIPTYIKGLFVIYTFFILFVLGKLTFLIKDVLLWLGNISYTLYLIHNFIGLKIVIPFFKNYCHLNLIFSIFLSLGTILFLSHYIYVLVEKPCLIYSKQKLKEWKPKKLSIINHRED